MPKRKDIKKILIIGAGPIVIGQACEFDYSGAQACKALKEENFKVVLVNSNPATIMTDPNLADRTYIEPLDVETISKIIEREKPDALLSTMGGQTALNLSIELERRKILKKFNVKLIGASQKVINKAEDRDLFKKAMKKIDIETPKGFIVNNLKESERALKNLDFPIIVRPSFTLGGAGGGTANSIKEYQKIVKKGLSLSPINEVLVEESLIGWKEYEMEVIRDKKDNCIIVCSIEN
ncbi:MAG: carbamoyl phosphate synthase large subunit, partial [Alphaproteobacteria bacterium]